jgi:hypothetical protein
LLRLLGLVVGPSEEKECFFLDKFNESQIVYAAGGSAKESGKR